MNPHAITYAPGTPPLSLGDDARRTRARIAQERSRARRFRTNRGIIPAGLAFGPASVEDASRRLDALAP